MQVTLTTSETRQPSRLSRGPGLFRFLAAALVALPLLSACGADSSAPQDVSPLLSNEAPVQSSAVAASFSPSPQASPSYLVTDVEVLEVDDPVAQLIWAVRFDADWTGDGAAPKMTCRWRMYDPYGDQNALGVVEVSEASDITTDFVYPDEVAGRPTTARVVC